jgi:hypothetical protein
MNKSKANAQQVVAVTVRTYQHHIAAIEES